MNGSTTSHGRTRAAARAHIEAQLVDGRWHDAWDVLGAADDLTLDAMLDAAKLLGVETRIVEAEDQRGEDTALWRLRRTA